MNPAAMAALGSKLATLGSAAREAARVAARQGCAYNKAVVEGSRQLQSRACEATRSAAKHGRAFHEELMERNKRYVVDPPTIQTCQELSKQLFYTRLASIPGRYESFWKEVDGAKLLWKNRKNLNLKTEDIGVATLFGIELIAWFAGGEVVGRGFTFTGYHV
ncbi:uncharacterized protein LOC127760265 [Oryza glaberrima]|nr:uncharacterized protein LOC127760265 [Oryza glaberrima]